MRIRGYVASILVAVALGGPTVLAQEQDADPRDQKIASLEKDLAEQKKQTETLITQVTKLATPKPPEPTPAEQKQKTRETYAAVFKQARDRGEQGCKDAGGKRFLVTIDATGKPGASCEF